MGGAAHRCVHCQSSVENQSIMKVLRRGEKMSITIVTRTIRSHREPTAHCSSSQSHTAPQTQSSPIHSASRYRKPKRHISRREKKATKDIKALKKVCKQDAKWRERMRFEVGLQRGLFEREQPFSPDKALEPGEDALASSTDAGGFDPRTGSWFGPVVAGMDQRVSDALRGIEMLGWGGVSDEEKSSSAGRGSAGRKSSAGRASSAGRKSPGKAIRDAEEDGAFLTQDGEAPSPKRGPVTPDRELSILAVDDEDYAGSHAMQDDNSLGRKLIWSGAIGSSS